MAPADLYAAWRLSSEEAFSATLPLRSATPAGLTHSGRLPLGAGASAATPVTHDAAWNAAAAR